MSLSGGLALFGFTTNGRNGTAAIFRQMGDKWNETDIASPGFPVSPLAHDPGDTFGSAVAICGNTAIIDQQANTSYVYHLIVAP